MTGGVVLFHQDEQHLAIMLPPRPDTRIRRCRRGCCADDVAGGVDRGGGAFDAVMVNRTPRSMMRRSAGLRSRVAGAKALRGEIQGVAPVP